MISSLRAVNQELGLSGRRVFSCSRKTLMSAESGNDPDLNAYDKSQVDQLSDKCVLVDENDKIVGSASKKECHLAFTGEGVMTRGLLHRAFSVLLFNSKNELLLQQRSSLKITYPLHYTNTCCSHPRANEVEMSETDNVGIKIAAQRRMQFELGIPEHQLPITDIHFLTKINYNSPAGDIWAENELDHVVFIKMDVDLQPNDDEVADVKFVNQEGLHEFIQNADKKGILITPWFRYIYENFLDKWWNNLSNDKSNLLELKDNKIWRAGSIS